MCKRLLFNTLSVIFIAATVIACSGSKQVLRHPTTSGTLWVQHSAEYDALTTLVYRTASSNLSPAIEDSYWTASVQQKQAGEYQDLPPAVILDLDETVLDNSAFQARMISQNSSFNVEQWNEWVLEAKADAIPGALEFVTQAVREGVEIFYLTNREASVEKGTRKNLQTLGFPLPENRDVILSKNEKENWTSVKVNRRSFVGERYRILMLFGDNLNDFIPAEDISREKRDSLVSNHDSNWGRTWYMLPNPVYGSWEQALYDFDNSLSEKEIKRIKERSLNQKY